MADCESLLPRLSGRRAVAGKYLVRHFRRPGSERNQETSLMFVGYRAPRIRALLLQLLGVRSVFIGCWLRAKLAPLLQLLGG